MVNDQNHDFLFFVHFVLSAKIVRKKKLKKNQYRYLYKTTIDRQVWCIYRSKQKTTQMQANTLFLESTRYQFFRVRLSTSPPGIHFLLFSMLYFRSLSDLTYHVESRNNNNNKNKPHSKKKTKKKKRKKKPDRASKPKQKAQKKQLIKRRKQTFRENSLLFSIYV